MMMRRPGNVGVVIAAPQRLPRSQRRAVVLHYMGDVPVEELAQRAATAPATTDPGTGDPGATDPGA